MLKISCLKSEKIRGSCLKKNRVKSKDKDRLGEA